MIMPSTARPVEEQPYVSIPVRFIASEGSVSLIDLKQTNSVKEIVTGRHASALAVSPDRRWVVCANAADDFLSVIDLSVQKVGRSIWTKPSPADLFGAGPNALGIQRHKGIGFTSPTVRKTRSA